MKFYRIILLSFTFLALTSFSVPKAHDFNLLKKVWITQSYDKEKMIFSYKAKNRMPKKRLAFQFLENGKLKVRQNNSWCGTIGKNERINYETVEGSWEKISDSVFVMKYPRWGMDSTQKMHILKLTDDILVTKILSQ